MSSEADSRLSTLEGDSPPGGGVWPEEDRRQRRWVWPVALVTALVVALGLSLFRHLGQGGGPMQGPSPSTAAQSGGNAAPVAGGASREPGAAGRSSVAEASPQLAQAGETAARLARATSAALAAVTQLGADTPAPERSLEMCDLGRLTVDRSPPPSGSAASAAATLPGSVTPAGLPPALGRQARAAVWPELLAALEAPGQLVRARAAAQLVRAWGVDTAEEEATAAVTTAADGAAGPGAQGPAAPAASASAGPGPARGATRTATRTQTRAQTRAVAALARLARPEQRGQALHGDATALRWALAMCARQARPGAECRRIGPRDLVRVAPDDSSSWLLLAAELGPSSAQGRAALQRAASAAQFTRLGSALALQLDAVWPVQRPGFVRVQLLAQARAIERRLDEASLPFVLQTCSEPALTPPPGPDRLHPVCEALARQAQARGPDLDWLAAAATLGERLGWPEAQRSSLRREEVALTGLQAPPPAVLEQPLSCPALAWTRGQLLGAATAGELAWLRQRAAVQPGSATGDTAAGPSAGPPASLEASPAGRTPAADPPQAGDTAASGRR